MANYSPHFSFFKYFSVCSTNNHGRFSKLSFSSQSAWVESEYWPTGNNPPPHHGNWGEQSHIKNCKLIYSIWAITVLVLLTQQHYNIKSTNTFGNFDHMLAPILMVQLAKSHQYMGVIDMVAPMYWWNWASCTNRCRITNILRILRFRWFFLCLHHLYLDATGYQHQYIGVLQRESKC